ncbi:MAG: UDP-glucose 4-epimerase GalE [Anaerolineae bacterium]|nr:UDP-glucose 4-epimerase GalE [Anaerolineae bacterium]
MHILVTGGAGYVGSATAAYFLAAGHRVTVFDSLATGHRAAIPAGAAFVQGSLADCGALDVLFQTHAFDAVAHFAASIEAGESMLRPGKYFENNVACTNHLLETMMRRGVGRLIFSSTAGVYASKDEPLSEDDPLGPANVYGETKLMIERMLEWYHRVAGLNYAALRYFNACGAMLAPDGIPVRGEAHEPETHLIPLTLQVPLGQREAIMIFGTDYNTPDGTCIRDYVHIEDLASAHVLALEALDSNRERMIFNLGNGRGYSVREVIETARQVTGVDFPAVEAPRRPGDADRLVASSERISRELGWEPRYPDLRQIIASAWAWHTTHPHGYRDAAAKPASPVAGG